MSDEDKKAADQQAETVEENNDSKNDEGKDTQETKDTQAVEDGKEKAGNDVKKEESPYEKQLKELNDSIAKKDDIIEKKNRALNSEKNKRKEAEDALADKEDEIDDDKSLSKSDREALKAEMRAEYRAERQIEKFEEALESHTNDKVKRELVRKIYDHKIVKSGNVQEDLANALAIADRNVNAALIEKQAQMERDENDMADYQSSDVRGEADSKSQNPAHKIAAQILRNAGKEKAIKHLK